MLKKLKQRWLLFTLLFFGIAILLYLSYKTAALFYFWMVIPWLAAQLTEIGLDIWLARAIVIPIAILFWFVIKMFFSRDPLKKRWAYILTAIIAVLYCLGMYFVQRDFAFNPRTGEATKCYAETPWGNEYISCDFKYHPIVQSEVKPVTPDIAIARILGKKKYPEIKRVTYKRNMALFGPNGNPLVWYYQWPDGKIELFPGPGHHPEIGVVLTPITPEIALKLLESAKRSDAEKKIIIHQPENKGAGYQVPDLKGLRELSQTLEEFTD